MFWYNVISHNSSYYFKMYISEITKFPCQLHYYELSSNLKPWSFLSLLSFTDSSGCTLMLLQKCSYKGFHLQGIHGKDSDKYRFLVTDYTAELNE